jgi:hypothetical protein
MTGWNTLKKPSPKKLQDSLKKLRDALLPLKEQLDKEVAKMQPEVDAALKAQEETNA